MYTKFFGIKALGVALIACALLIAPALSGRKAASANNLRASADSPRAMFSINNHLTAQNEGKPKEPRPKPKPGPPDGDDDG